jgi:hypothetical protein
VFLHEHLKHGREPLTSIPISYRKGEVRAKGSFLKKCLDSSPWQEFSAPSPRLQTKDMIITFFGGWSRKAVIILKITSKSRPRPSRCAGINTILRLAYEGSGGSEEADALTICAVTSICESIRRRNTSPHIVTAADVILEVMERVNAFEKAHARSALQHKQLGDCPKYVHMPDERDGGVRHRLR